MKINLEKIPKNPGCYLYKNKKGEVIYIGKSKNLAKRVKSYFIKTFEGGKTKALVKNIYSIDFFVTDNEVEALILENNLIKKHKPKYNIVLKDSRRYAFIQITDEEFPRLLVSRKREGKGDFYGPFVSAAARDLVIEAVRRIFQIRTCNKLPKRECLRSSIGLCSAPCTKKISKEDYLSDIKSAKLVLRGKYSDLIKILTQDMKSASLIQDYERALVFKNQISAILNLDEKQKMERQKNYDEDIINYIQVKDKIHLMLFHSKKGILETKQDFEFDYKKDFLEEFLLQYYFENEIPKRIVLPEKIGEDLIEVLRKKKKKLLKGLVRVEVVVPKKGELKELLDLVKKNLEINLFGNMEKIEDLMNKLKLQELPKVIECFDISHLSGTSTVASMVQFRNGKSDKSNYRKYKIKTVNQIDDFASLKEVVKRRYSKLKNENLPMPNLIIIDGGKGQLSSVMETLDELDLKLVVISLAKREEEIFIPGKSKPSILDRKSKALKLVQEIRDEAHRFAINFNRQLRSKTLFD